VNVEGIDIDLIMKRKADVVYAMDNTTQNSELESKEEIEKWRAERRRNFPTREKVAQKEAMGSEVQENCDNSNTEGDPQEITGAFLIKKYQEIGKKAKLTDDLEKIARLANLAKEQKGTISAKMINQNL